MEELITCHDQVETLQYIFIVLRSCKTPEQLKNAYRLFTNYSSNRNLLPGTAKMVSMIIEYNVDKAKRLAA